MSREPETLARELERELVDGLAPRRRRALIERLRGNPDQRREWDQTVAAIRVIEDRPVSRFEIDQVERWLFEDLDEAGVIADRRRSRRWGVWLGLGLASLATAAVAVWWIGADPWEGADELARVDGPGSDREPDELVARGRGVARPLAIEPVCGTPPRPAARGCRADELLGFSVRLGAETLTPAAAAALAASPVSLTLFGLGDAGEVLYYLPTPVDPERPTLALELGTDPAWQPLPVSVRLGVNHPLGRVRVFALASDATPSVTEIDELAASLRPHPRANVDDPPWHLRLGEPALARLCPDLDRCSAAEAEFELTPAAVRPSPTPADAGSKAP